MPWGVAAAAVVGYASTNNAAKKGAAATGNASKQATQLQRDQFERGMEEVAPFKQIGIGALDNLGRAANDPITPFAFRDSSAYLDDYFNSDEYNILNKQSSDQILRSASATGGLRSGNSNANLAQIAPTLGINALDRVNQKDLQAYGVNQGAISDRFSRLYGVANMGANVAGGNQSAGMQFGSQAGNNAITAGNAQNLAYQQQAQAINGLATDLGGLYAGNRMGYFDKANGGKV